MGEIDINMDALADVEVGGSIPILAYAFNGTQDQSLVPCILRLHQAWEDDDGCRILAFFMRDNPALLPYARRVLGLETLDWGDAMLESAIEADDFSKLAVMALAGLDPVGDPQATFLEALADKKYGRVIATIVFKGEALAEALGESWALHYGKLSQEKGMSYMAAQLLVGAMHAYEPNAMKRGLAAAAAAHAGDAPVDVRMNYINDQGEHFSPKSNPQAAFEALVMEDWDNY